MLRIAYALTILTLIGGSAVTAHGIDRDSRAERAPMILMLAGMPRYAPGLPCRTASGRFDEFLKRTTAATLRGELVRRKASDGYGRRSTGNRRDLRFGCGWA